MRLLLLVLIALVISFSSFGQREVEEGTNPPFKDRIYFGGGLGFSSGNNGLGRYTYFNVNPIVGYMITPQLSSGLGFQWAHYSFQDYGTSFNQYGISPFVRYNFGQIFTYGEYNLINTSSINEQLRRNYNRLLLGLGFSQPLGRRGSINAMALYDVLYKVNGPFQSPWVLRVYFSF